MAKRKKSKPVVAEIPEKVEQSKFLVYAAAGITLFILADLFTILYFNRKSPIPVSYVATNPGPENFVNLPIGGIIEKKLPVVNDLKLKMSDEPVFMGKDPVYSLNVCCPGGLSKDFYTAKMPWAFIMYDFEPGLPTVVLFEMDTDKKQGRFEIVVLDPKADMEKLRAVSVRIFTELVKKYKPGYEWRGSVRQEIN